MPIEPEDTMIEDCWLKIEDLGSAFADQFKKNIDKPLSERRGVSSNDKVSLS